MRGGSATSAEDSGHAGGDAGHACAPSVRKLPSAFPRRALLAVVGTSPQVLTETVYALTQTSAPPERLVPTEVHVITTSVGARRLYGELLVPVDGAWWQLLRDYALPPIAFDESHVIVVADAAGTALDDIRTAQDNGRVADAISERVREITSDPDAALHVSLAGGRKTMGYYAGYALSLFGRAQDRLSHVLVPPEVEALPGFHYPTPGPHLLPGRAGAPPVDASRVGVELAEIPFVRLRPLLPPTLLDTRSSFAAVVEGARVSAAPPRLQLDVSRRRFVADGQALELTVTQFALMAALAHRARERKPPLPAPLRDAHDAAWAQAFLADLRAGVGLMHVDDGVAESVARECSGNKISPHLSRLRKLLRERLGAGRAALYFDDGGVHRHKRYCVPLPPESIEFTAAPSGCKLAETQAGAGSPDTPSAPGQLRHPGRR